MLIVAESTMIWRNGQATWNGRSASQADMDIPKMIPSPKGKELAMVKSDDHKRKAISKTALCANSNEPKCFYCQGKGHWNRSCLTT